MSEETTLRIWTNMGKEHIYPVNYFRTHCNTLEIGSNDLDSILHTVAGGEPCNISLLTYSSGNKAKPYSEHQYRGCTVVKGSIRYLAICVPA